MNRGHRAITTVNAITTVKGLLAVLAVIFALGAITGPCHAGSKIAVGRNWSPGDRISMDRIDHDVWDGLLRKYVDSVGDVNYSRWKASATRRSVSSSRLRPSNCSPTGIPETRPHGTEIPGTPTRFAVTV